MKNALSSFACGFVFAAGLAISGMTQPAKVIGFLDVFGAWDPSLAFVMASALTVLFVARALTPRRPLLAASFAGLPPDRIDARLVAGAAIFGVGWGLSGFCPGPAVVSLGAGTTASLVIVPAMLVGMAAHRSFERWAGRLGAVSHIDAPGVSSVEAPSPQAGCG